jgi:uncharacterized protein (TIGR03437 family)
VDPGRLASKIDIMHPAIAPIKDAEFVRRIGSTLMLGGAPFRFNGNNVYYNQAEYVYGRGATVEETFDKMVALGISVTRSNAHNDHPPANDPAAIQTSPGVYVESSLVALDRSVAAAKQRHLRMILKLTNNWDAYGGIRRYVAWQLGRAPNNNEVSRFYTDATIKQWFKNYVLMIIGRRNTVTGILYKDEPAILAWELGNELRNTAPGTADELLAWEAEMAAYIKSIDPNHLVADGGEGFDDDRNQYPGLSNSYPVNGSDRASYRRMVQIPDIDLVSYHLYPSNWGLNDTTDVAIWIKRHEEIAREANKVAYFGEYGKPLTRPCNGCPQEQVRANLFRTWLTENAINQGAIGYMAWQLINDARGDSEGYQIYCPLDMATCALLAEFSAIANAPPAAVTSGASYQPVWLAAEAFGSLFGVGLVDQTEAAPGLPLPTQLAGAKLEVLDSKGVARDAELHYAGPTQFNFIVPKGTAPGGAVVRLIRNGQITKTATISISATAPGIFSADASGTGYAAGIVTILRPDQTRIEHFVANTPIDLAAGDAVVALFGTGWRAAQGAEVTIGGLPATVLYLGAQGQFPGLDQLNARIPPQLAGRGLVDVVMTVSGQAANMVKLAVK